MARGRDILEQDLDANALAVINAASIRIGTRKVLNNATGILAYLHALSTDSSKATVARLQGNSNTALQLWRGQPGVSGGADDEWQVGYIQGADLAGGGAHRGAIDIYANVNGGVATGEWCVSFHNGGARLLGALGVGLNAIDSTWIGKGMIVFQAKGTIPTSNSGQANLAYQSGSINRVTLSNNGGPTSPIATLADIPGAGGGVATKTTTYTITDTDDFLLGDATSAGFTMTLPTPVGRTGRVFTVKKKDSSGNAVTIATAAGTIDGSSTVALSTQYQSRTVRSDGANWWIVAAVG